MSDAIRTKPHHFIDIICDYGQGREEWEPSAYGHAVHVVAARVISERNVTLEMTSGADDICAPCVHNINGLCDDTIETSFRPDAPPSKREWNLIIDGRWYERLELKDGECLTATRFVRLLPEVTAEEIDLIYRELPPEMRAERLKQMRSGAEKYLAPAAR